MSSAPQPVTGCDAARRLEALLGNQRSPRVAVTQEWLEENRAKQEAYARHRQEWQRQFQRQDE